MDVGVSESVPTIWARHQPPVSIQDHGSPHLQGDADGKSHSNTKCQFTPETVQYLLLLYYLIHVGFVLHQADRDYREHNYFCAFVQISIEYSFRISALRCSSHVATSARE